MDLRRHSPSVRNYLSGPEQRRLLLMVATLGLVLFLMNEARKPKHWRWLTNPAVEPRQEVTADRPPEREQNGSPVAPLRDFDRRSLEAVRDDTTFRDEEKAAWFGLFSLLEEANPKSLEKASLGKVAYVQLFDQPDVYRGKVVTLGGTIRQALYRTAPENDSGIEGYYKMVLEPDDGSENPILVYALELPRGFPTGIRVDAKVRFSGVFFKRWIYLAGDGIRSAPVVLAKTVSWTPPAPKSVPEDEPPSPIAVIIGGLALAGLVILFVYRRTRRTHSVEAADLSEIHLAPEEETTDDESAEEQSRTNDKDEPSS